MDNPSQTSAVSSGKALSQAVDLTGRTLGDYLILRCLGQGGMGQVYLAEQQSLRRKVALKIMRADLAANATSLQRFRLEAESVARATHANIVQVYAVGEVDGLHFMALEYVDGRNLKEYLAKKGPPDLALALSIMRQTAAALQRASELGIIHRDIKPENIMLTRKGEVKVADFGLSRCLAPDAKPLDLTQTGVTMGTPLYMSPEQVEGRQLDPRTDIYSFGVTSYHMLAGRPPFRGETAFEVALQHVQTEPVPLEKVRPDLPAALCAIINKMMAKKPHDRYQTGREVLKDLVRLRDGLPATPGTVTVSAAGTQRALPLVGRLMAGRRWLLPVAVVLSLVLAAALGAALGWARLPKREVPSEAPEEPADTGAVESLFSTQDKEKFLNQAVEQYADPGKDANRLKLGVGHCVELGTLYLEQGRLHDADDLFARLQQRPIKEYVFLGRLGHAIVLGLENRPAESNQAFLDVLGKKEGPIGAFWRGPLLRENPSLRLWIARALDFNVANEGDKFPRELQVLRRPVPGNRWSPPPGRGGADKSPGDK
jgi:serine/threonine-protein kinase